MLTGEVFAAMLEVLVEDDCIDEDPAPEDEAVDATGVKVVSPLMMSVSVLITDIVVGAATILLA